MSKIIETGAATAFFNDRRMGIDQLLDKAASLDYIIFDFLAESVMGGLSRAKGLTLAMRHANCIKRQRNCMSDCP